MKKRITVFIGFLFLLMLIACGGKDEKINTSFFEINKATDAGKEYMSQLSLDKNNSIKAYNLEKVTEAADYVVLEYKVLRKKDNNISEDLDNFNIKVVMDEGKYVVDRLIAKNSMQLYVDGNNIRVREKDTGMSELLLRKKDLPIEVYPQNNDIMTDKVNVTNEQYSQLALDFKGKNVGVITKNNNENFIVFSQIKNTQETVGEVDSTGGDNVSTGDRGVDINTLEDVLEKPIASKIVPYDLVQAENIDELVFTADGDFLLVHINDNQVGRLNIYKNPTGEKVDMNLEEIFPSDKYTLTINQINETGTYIDVRALGDDKKEEGLYKFEFKSKKISKEE